MEESSDQETLVTNYRNRFLTRLFRTSLYGYKLLNRGENWRISFSALYNGEPSGYTINFSQQNFVEYFQKLIFQNSASQNSTLLSYKTFQ